MLHVLDGEVKRWSDMSIAQLSSRLSDLRSYQIEQNGTVYQFEVEILENRPAYIVVDVRVDDGRLPCSIHPMGQSFRKSKQTPEP